jgi:hypothetical protein
MTQKTDHVIILAIKVRDKNISRKNLLVYKAPGLLKGFGSDSGLLNANRQE